MQLDFLNKSSLAKADPAENKPLAAKPNARALCIDINFILKSLDGPAVFSLLGMGWNPFSKRPRCHWTVRPVTNQVGVIR